MGQLEEAFGREHDTRAWVRAISAVSAANSGGRSAGVCPAMPRAAKAKGWWEWSDQVPVSGTSRPCSRSAGRARCSMCWIAEVPVLSMPTCKRRSGFGTVIGSPFSGGRVCSFASGGLAGLLASGGLAVDPRIGARIRAGSNFAAAAVTAAVAVARRAGSVAKAAMRAARSSMGTCHASSGCRSPARVPSGAASMRGISPIAEAIIGRPDCRHSMSTSGKLSPPRTGGEKAHVGQREMRARVRAEARSVTKAGSFGSAASRS